MKIKSAFIKQLGDTPQLRILNFLIPNYYFDYPMTEIAKESNISYHSFQKVLPQFIDSKILVKTRRVGKSDYFLLSRKHPFIKKIMPLYWSIVKANVFKDEIKLSELKT